MNTNEVVAAIVGKVISKVVVSDEEITLECADGEAFRMYHMQDCCEHVRVHDIQGDLQDLVNKTITGASETSSQDWPADVERPDFLESFTWTTFVLHAGTTTVTIRWLGESNGYYGEEVYFTRTLPTVDGFGKGAA